MKKKNLLTLGLSCLLCFGAMTLASCGGSKPSEGTKYTVNVDAPEQATVSGLRADKKYEADERVVFTVQTSPSYYTVDSVKVNDVPLTLVNSQYSFGMPAQDVTLKVAVKDARTTTLELASETIEVKGSTTYTVKFGGVEISEYDLVASPASSVTIDKTTKTITGVSEGAVTLTATVEGRSATKTLTINKSSVMSLNESYVEALKTDAKKNGKCTGAAYTIPSEVVAKGGIAPSGYGDVIIADNEGYSLCNVNTATFNSVSVGDEVLTKGEITNYFGLLEFKYNKDGAKAMDFTKSTTGITPVAAEAMDATSYEAYYNDAVTASTASQSTAGNTIDDLVYVKRVTGQVKVYDAADGTRGLIFDGATHYLNIVSTDETSEARKLVEASLPGAILNIEAFILGSNTSKSRSNTILLTASKVAYDVKSVSIQNDKEEINYNDTATMTATVDPAQAALQYGVTYTASPAEAVTINGNKIVGKQVDEDTQVTIKGSCNGVESTAVTITVKAAQIGAVIIATTERELIINDDPITLEGYVVGHEEATLTWTIDDSTKASINGNVLTGLAAGNIVVTATSSLDSTKTSSIDMEVKYDLSKPINASIAEVNADKTYDQTHLYKVSDAVVKSVQNAGYGRITLTDGTDDLVIYSSRIENPDNPSLSYTEGKWSHDFSKGDDPTPMAVVGTKVTMLVYGIVSSGTYKNYYAVTASYEAQHATSFTAPDTLTVNVGSLKNIGVVTTPFLTVDAITYTSSDPTVATVAKNGDVSGLTEGTCNITVKVGETLEPKTVAVTVEPALEYTLKASYDLSDFGKDQTTITTTGEIGGSGTTVENTLAVLKGKAVGTDIVSGLSANSKAYVGQNDHTAKGWKFGTSSLDGTITITLSTAVDRLVVNAYAYATTDTVTINGISKSFTKKYTESGAKTTHTFDFAEATKTITIKFSKRGFIQDLAFYVIEK